MRKDAAGILATKLETRGKYANHNAESLYFYSVQSSLYIL